MRARLELSEAGRSRRPAVDTTGESADTAAAGTNTPDADKGAGTEAPTPSNDSHVLPTRQTIATSETVMPRYPYCLM